MPTLLVLGNEGEGMRPVIRKSCQTLCYLEQEPSIALKKWPNIVDSLNVSVAAALLLNRLQAL
jgi:tRNA G18 (ribose-2'-O)-methylase SpoU